MDHTTRDAVSRMKTLASAIMLHEGWEMDNEAWVKEDAKGNRHFCWTNHGSVPEIAGEDILDEFIKSTRESLGQLEKLKEILGRNK